jgi:DNA (cytosine-5)-methyltransferase 1
LADINDHKIEEIPRHDLLTAGFPCQPFSIAGKKEGFDDYRSNVFWKLLEIIRYHQPMIVVLENVKNLTTHDDMKTFRTIKEKLEELEYLLKYKVGDTSLITGIPQHRERIYIICFRKDLIKIADQFDLEFKSKKKNRLSKYLIDSSLVNKSYYYSDKYKIWDSLKEKCTDDDVIYQYRRYYVRANKSNCCPTLTANMGTGGHNVPIIRDSNGIRKLTPRECFNFQGFPADYILPNISDSKLYKLAGNAVSVPVVQLIANRLIELMSQNQIEPDCLTKSIENQLKIERKDNILKSEKILKKYFLQIRNQQTHQQTH